MIDKITCRHGQKYREDETLLWDYWNNSYWMLCSMDILSWNHAVLDTPYTCTRQLSNVFIILWYIFIFWILLQHCTNSFKSHFFIYKVLRIYDKLFLAHVNTKTLSPSHTPHPTHLLLCRHVLLLKDWCAVVAVMRHNHVPCHYVSVHAF